LSNQANKIIDLEAFAIFLETLRFATTTPSLVSDSRLLREQKKRMTKLSQRMNKICEK
jgi:hypothetical protein